MPATSKELGKSQQKRVTVRADEELIADFDEVVENRSEAIREFMRETVNDNADHNLTLPSDRKARTGLKVMTQHAYRWDEGFIVKIEDVREAIKDAANVSEGSLKRKVIAPLKGDYIKPAGPGRFEIHPQVAQELRE